MVSAGINYRETYFEFPELTKLPGEPTCESLFRLRNELKANAQSVYSNLSDGAHGHLALVLSDAQYALITDTPFNRPTHPGALAIPAPTTAAMATVLKEAHQESLRLFREVQGVEKALIQQIVQAVESPYLASIRDRASNSLQGTVRQILEHLQTVYGRVSPQMLEDREQELRNTTYNTQYPIDTVFNAVEDYVDFAELGSQPLTQRQIIAKAYVILNKTRRFRNDITEWNRRPEVDKTWVNFKTHFRRAHQEFRETTDVTLEESDLRRNNANLVQQVVAGIQDAMVSETPPTNDPNAEIIAQMANSATRSSEVQQQLQTQLQQMQQAMGLLQTQLSNQTYNQYQPSGGRNTYGYQGQSGHGNYQGYQGRGGEGRGRGGRGQYRTRNTSIYCWTHGGSGHTSANCKAKVTGHQDCATFQDKMGGSTRNCPP
jgi:type II secretory pathway component PulJ